MVYANKDNIMTSAQPGHFSPVCSSALFCQDVELSFAVSPRSRALRTFNIHTSPLNFSLDWQPLLRAATYVTV